MCKNCSDNLITLFSFNTLGVVNYHLKHTGLELNLELERKTLADEIQMFYLSDNFIERLKFFCSFFFVHIGSMAKIDSSLYKTMTDNVQPFSSIEIFHKTRKEFDDLQNVAWQMFNIVCEELDKYFGLENPSVIDIVNECFADVLLYRQQKGSEVSLHKALSLEDKISQIVEKYARGKNINPGDWTLIEETSYNPGGSI